MDDVSAVQIRKPSKWRAKNSAFTLKRLHAARRERLAAMDKPVLCAAGGHWKEAVEFEMRCVSGKWIRYVDCKKCRSKCRSKLAGKAPELRERSGLSDLSGIGKVEDTTPQ